MDSITKSHYLKLDDPEFNRKYITIQTLNRISDLLRYIKNERDNSLYFVAAIFIGIATNIFINLEDFFMVLLLSNILLLILIRLIIKKNKEFLNIRNEAKPSFILAKKLNLNIPFIENYL